MTALQSAVQDRAKKEKNTKESGYERIRQQSSSDIIHAQMTCLCLLAIVAALCLIGGN